MDKKEYKKIDTEIKYFECQCDSPNHVIRFVVDDWDDGKNIDVYLETQLCQNYGFFRRLLLGIKYIIGCKNEMCHWDCTYIKKEDVKPITDILNKIKH
jgi:hypothetical protein